MIVNISPEGVPIEVTDPTSIPRTFKLMTANDRVVRNCRIVWIKLNTLGVRSLMRVTPRLNSLPAEDIRPTPQPAL
jgi:hypothetical protein